VIEYEPSFEEFREECLKITYYYFEERYPFFVESGITEEEVKGSFMVAKNIIDRILKLYKHEN